VLLSSAKADLANTIRTYAWALELIGTYNFKTKTDSTTSCLGSIGIHFIENSDAPPEADSSFEYAPDAHKNTSADVFRCTSKGSLILMKYIDDAGRLTVVDGDDVERVCKSVGFLGTTTVLFDVKSAQDEIGASVLIPNESLPDSNPGDVFMSYTDSAEEEPWVF
jgi:hypothetical protein